MKRVRQIVRSGHLRLMLSTALGAISFQTSAAAQDTSQVIIGRVDEACSVGLNLDIVDRDRFYLLVDLACLSPKEDALVAKKRVSEATVWLLRANGTAAVHNGKTGNTLMPLGPEPQKDISIYLGTAFQNVRDPVAVVVKYEGRFHVFPVSEDDLQKIKMP